MRDFFFFWLGANSKNGSGGGGSSLGDTLGSIVLFCIFVPGGIYIAYRIFMFVLGLGGFLFLFGFIALPFVLIWEWFFS